MIFSGSDPRNIDQAAERIRSGGLVAFPTETVYGLGADASSDQAVAQIFLAKGRPSDHPLIVHVADASQAQEYAQDIPHFASRLMQAFWPGALTLILPRKANVASAAAAAQNTIGLRCPSHPVAQAFLKACAVGVAAPSANRFGRVSPTTAAHVQQEFGEALWVLDGGACELGIESAIIDCSRGHPILLRPGVLTRPQLQAACDQPVLSMDDELAIATGDTPRASGTLAAHYAPSARVRLMDRTALQTALDLLGADAANIAVYARAIVRIKSDRVAYRRMPDDAAATAQQLFAVLRDFDAKKVKLIWVEHVPDGPEWDGVRDRLQRAAAS